MNGESATQRLSGMICFTLDLYTGTFSITDMMSILRDTDSGINREEGTCGSMVSVITQGASSTPACHWLTATPDPALSMFKPFIFTPSVAIGNLTISPDYGAEDPARVVPRFSRKVDRQHPLYKAHELLVRLQTTEPARAAGIRENLVALETNCVGDMEEVLSNYDENAARKVAAMFSHMCTMEINFYK